MWGTYWVWDARLTSVLILFFLYLGLIALWPSIEDPARGGRAAAILALVGVIILPIIKFSVEWWNTLHQPASDLPHRRADHRSLAALAALGHGRRLHAPVRALHLKAMRNEILRRRVKALQLQVERAGAAGGRVDTMPRFRTARGFIWAAYAVTFVAVAASSG